MDEVLNGFASALRAAREHSGLNPLNVQTVSESEQERRHSKHFYVNNTTVRKYESGGWPSPPKLLTLSRIYSTPLAVFFRAIGATDAEICGHEFSKEEQRFIEMLKADPELAELHQQLQVVMESGSEQDRQSVRHLVEVLADRVAEQAEKPEPKEEPVRKSRQARVIPLKSPWVGHDEPQPLHTARLPYFEYRVPAGPPDQVDADCYRTIEVLRHMAKETRYVVKVSGTSMEPVIQDGDLLLVDYKEEARSGKIVCALVNGESTVKRFWRRKDLVILKAENPESKDIRVGKDDELKIQGVVLRIVGREL